jgi:bifunctional DNA-binding transcriptional regulator/antitoxin component of YhaV-PrlF toxin-antitoxin module
VTIPSAIRKHLGVGAPDKVAFVVEEDGRVALHRSKLTVDALCGIVPALPGRSTADFEDQIEEAKEEAAARIVSHLGGT